MAKKQITVGCLDGQYRSMTLKQYFASNEWDTKRKEFLKIAGYKCQNCGRSKSLVIHFPSYRITGKERYDQIKVFCWDCRKAHRSMKI